MGDAGDWWREHRAQRHYAVASAGRRDEAATHGSRKVDLNNRVPNGSDLHCEPQRIRGVVRKGRLDATAVSCSGEDCNVRVNVAIEGV
jgi:hypothetical protein